MKDAPTPADEALRIRNLRELDVLYSPAEERFDRITRLACRLFNVPIALVSLVAEDCQWFKSRQGLDADQTERRVSFCGHAIMASDVFLVPDATLHPDFSDNPLVTGDPFVRFYAGMPVSTPDGHNLGTLCLIDHMPRTFSEKEKQTLRDLAHWVENELRASGSAPLDEAERRAGLDPLTQSWNGLGMERLIRDELARASQRGSDLSVVGIVVTNYGEIGKEWGSIAGDRVLQETALILRQMLRPGESICRASTAEFVLVLPGSSDLAAARLAEKVSLKFASLHPSPESRVSTIAVTTSHAGVAGLETGSDGAVGAGLLARLHAGT